jgi:hypothetical protein
MRKVPLAKHDDMIQQSHTLSDRFGAAASGAGGSAQHLQCELRMRAILYKIAHFDSCLAQTKSGPLHEKGPSTELPSGDATRTRV